MRCNTISFVSRLIRKCFMREFLDIFEDVCSLHKCFSADSFRLLCSITPCECSGRFFAPPGICVSSSFSFRQLSAIQARVRVVLLMASSIAQCRLVECRFTHTEPVTLTSNCRDDGHRSLRPAGPYTF